MSQMEMMRRPVTRDLPVKLSDAEMAAVAREIGRLNAERQVMEANAKVANDQWKDRIRGVEARVADLATKAHEGQEARPTECQEEYDYRLGEVRVVRTDTGEKLEVRPMTSEERQPTLAGVSTEPKPKKGKAKLAAVPYLPPGAPVDPDGPPGAEITDPQAALDGAKTEPEDSK